MRGKVRRPRTLLWCACCVWVCRSFDISGRREYAQYSLREASPSLYILPYRTTKYCRLHAFWKGCNPVGGEKKDETGTTTNQSFYLERLER